MRGILVQILITIKKVIIKIILAISCVTLILFSAFQFALAVSKNKDRTIGKYKKYYMMMIAWLDLVEKGFALDKYLKEKEFNQVAVYGGRELGQHVIKSLKGTDVTVKYVIDKTVYPSQVDGLPVYRPDGQLPIVDTVIVTPIWDYTTIRNVILKQIKCPIISLEDIITGGKDEQSSNRCAKLPKLQRHD